jgi:hypothetical protein
VKLRKEVLILSLCFALTPTISQANTATDTACLNSLQYVESRLQQISTHLAQTSNIIHSESFLNNWMKENKFSTKFDVATYLFKTHLDNAKRLIYENQVYMESKYKADCFGAPYYETGLKAYGNSFNQGNSSPNNWWVRYSEVFEKVTLLQSAENNPLTPGSNSQGDDSSNGNAVAFRIKEVYGDLQNEANKRFGACLYKPFRDIPATPVLTKWTPSDLSSHLTLLNSWLDDEMKNLNQSRCNLDKKVEDQPLTKEQIYEKELTILKGYNALFDDVISEKLGPQIVGFYKWTTQPPNFLAGDFTDPKHIENFDLSARAWFEAESKNLSIQNTRIASSDWPKVIAATSAQYSSKFADLVSLNFGAGQYSFKNPLPSPKGMINSAEDYLNFFQTIKKWFDSESKLDRKNFRADGAQTTNSEAPVDTSTIIDEQEERPIATFTGKVTSTGTTIRINTNLNEEKLIVRASKKGARTLTFRITVSEDGIADLKTKKSLRNYSIRILFEGEVIHSGRV